MSDLPSGKWTALLIGHQWPDAASLGTLDLASAARKSIATAWANYAESLRLARTSALSEQQGLAADNTRRAFLRGEVRSNTIADKNTNLGSVYRRAHQATVNLRTELSAIAFRGNQKVEAIQQSNSTDSTKLANTIRVITEAQTSANYKAAEHSAIIFSVIQDALNVIGLETSAREFAATHGVNLSDSFRPPRLDELSDSLAPIFDKELKATADDLVSPSTALLSSGQDRIAISHASEQTQNARTDNATFSASQDDPTFDAPPYGSHPRYSTLLRGGQDAIDPPDQSSHPYVTTPASPLPGPTTAAAGEFRPVAGLGNACPPTPPNHASFGSTHAEAPIQPLSSADLAHGFNAGSQAGAPISTGAEAASANAVHAAHQTPTHTSAMPTPAVAHVTPVAASPEVAVAHAPAESAAPPTVIAAPQPTVQAVAPVPPPIAVTTTTSAPAALPAYGADLKAPAATVPAAASPTPAAPISAHLSGSAANTLGQPSVVRHQSAPAATAAGAFTERAVAATATGSIAGSAAAQATAQQRLRRLLASVARQAPELGWAIGERDAHTTVLTTDLASGWIPPNIKIPSGVTVPEPARRSGSLVGMLGATTLTAVHAPGQHLPLDNADGPTFSTCPRKTTDVEELHWELAQATKWRDGLPRLAHTLARAISSGTGYLDSEVELLQDALRSVANEALATYPNTEPDLIRNWQLLATIEALVKCETTCANYHLAWFRALSPTGSGK